MGEFLPLLFFWVAALIIGNISKAAKKNASQQKNGQNARQGSAARQSRPAQERPNRPADAHAKPSVSAPRPSVKTLEETHKDPGAHPFEAHMHVPEMDQEGAGTEGMDCCHDFMLTRREEEPGSDLLSLQEDNENERAQALLQGVIFSEILGRRPTRRYGGRHA